MKVNSQIFDHTNAGGTWYSTGLNGSLNERTGLAKSLSVMPALPAEAQRRRGDTVRTEVYVKYLDPNSSNWTVAMNSLVTSIANGTAPANTFIDGGSPGSTGGVTAPHLGALNKSGETGTAPKAYLNYIIFDRDYIIKDGGFVRVTTAAREYGQDGAHEKLSASITVSEPGYIYLYLSNDNVSLGGAQVEVYFDNFKVEHVKSPVVGSQDYYPFGHRFNSYSRENSILNKNLYNSGSELQTDLDLGTYITDFRMYDPAMNRWWQIDPLADKEDQESWTPYNYSFNNPVRYNDPRGDCPQCLWGAVIGAAVDYGLQVTTNLVQGKDLGDALTDVNVGSILVSAGSGALSGGLSTLSKLNKVSGLARATLDITVDVTASVAGQAVRGEELSLPKTFVDVASSQTLGKVLSNKAKNVAVDSPKGKQLQANVNQQKNIANGKSSTTPKSKADVPGAKQKLDRYVAKKSIGTGAAASGVFSTVAGVGGDSKKKEEKKDGKQ